MICIVHLAIMSLGDVHRGEEMGLKPTNESHNINHHFWGLHPMTRTSQVVTHPKTPLDQVRLTVEFPYNQAHLACYPICKTLASIVPYELSSESSLHSYYLSIEGLS